MTPLRNMRKMLDAVDLVHETYGLDRTYLTWVCNQESLGYILNEMEQCGGVFINWSDKIELDGIPIKISTGFERNCAALLLDNSFVLCYVVLSSDHLHNEP